MKKANIMLDDKSTGLTIVEKADFLGVDAIHDALCFAFYPDGIGDEEEISDKFMALWHISLATLGWTEDEFWEEFNMHRETCPDCGGKMDDLTEVKVDGKDAPPESKPN